MEEIKNAMVELSLIHIYYGPKPKIGKHLVMDKGTSQQRTYSILNCEEEAGIYRITMERTRQ